MNREPPSKTLHWRMCAMTRALGLVSEWANAGPQPTTTCVGAPTRAIRDHAQEVFRSKGMNTQVVEPNKRDARPDSHNCRSLHQLQPQTCTGLWRTREVANNYAVIGRFSARTAFPEFVVCVSPWQPPVSRMAHKQVAAAKRCFVIGTSIFGQLARGGPEFSVE